MLDQVVGASVGLVIGVLISLFFERRSLAESRAEVEELKREIRSLTVGIVTIGGGSATRQAPRRARGAVEEMLSWLRGHQNADGRVKVDHLMIHFLTEWARLDVETTIEELVSSESIAWEGEWIRIR